MLPLKGGECGETLGYRESVITFAVDDKGGSLPFVDVGGRIPFRVGCFLVREGFPFELLDINSVMRQMTLVGRERSDAYLRFWEPKLICHKIDEFTRQFFTSLLGSSITTGDYKKEQPVS